MSPKKLIEVSIPLAEINKASATEKSLRHGNPSTLHLWWSRKPLATTRAVLWASLVDDPGNDSDRQKLHDILKKLVLWENTNNPDVLALARAELPDSLPEFLDPFAGGGSIPLEAQRLGLSAHAHDLNPIAVMLNKAMIEIPPKFSGKHPVHPDRQGKFTEPSLTSHAASGLAKDVEYYGGILRQKAFAQIGHLYPKIHTPDGDATVIAWLWARTVKCPNPNCKCHMPLVSSFMLSTKKDRKFCVLPHFDSSTLTYSVKHLADNEPEPKSPKTGKGKFICSACGTPVSNEYLHAEFSAHRDGRVMLAVVAESKNGRLYLSPDSEHVKAADVPRPEDFPDAEMNQDCTDLISGRGYGFTHWHQLFTNRQLTMLTAFSDLLPEVQEEVRRDALAAGWTEEDAQGYAEAVRVYLAFAVDKLTDYHSAFTSWHTSRELIRNTFSRQAIPMIWDYSESNPFCDSAGGFTSLLGWIVEVLEQLPAGPKGEAHQHDAQELDSSVKNMIVSTDPPYYDNIGYADLSDYFYIWMRRNLREVYPELFRRVLVPKDEELIATPYRHDDSPAKAREFFEAGMLEALKNIYRYATDEYPVTIYYAYKQKEAKDSEGGSAGWETMLKAVIAAGFQVTATWPIRTELTNRSVAQNANALGSSVVLVCRKRPENAKGTSRTNFERELREGLRPALEGFVREKMSPVDIPQSAIGPGMAVYSQYSEILDTNGKRVNVRDALAEVNRAVDEILLGGLEMDAESSFCVDMYRAGGFDFVRADDAIKLETARGVSIDGAVKLGVIRKAGSDVHLTDRDELTGGEESSVWVLTQRMAHAMSTGGVEGCAKVAGKVGTGFAEKARKLAYYLYTVADGRGWTKEAFAYNSLIADWDNIIEKSRKPLNQQLTITKELEDTNHE